MVTEATNQLDLLVKCIGLAFGILVPTALGIMGYLLNRSISAIDTDLVDIKKRINGSVDARGITARVASLEEQLPTVDKQVKTLAGKVNDLQTQIIDNQATLTRSINDNAEKTADELSKIQHSLGQIIGFLSKKDHL